MVGLGTMGRNLALNVEELGRRDPELLELHRGKFAVDADELTWLTIWQRP